MSERSEADGEIKRSGDDAVGEGLNGSSCSAATSGGWSAARTSRGRKVRWLLGLLKPYRGRVALMMIALLIATAAALAPPYLAGKAVDDGIIAGDTRRADADRDRVPRLGGRSTGRATYVQTYLVGWVGQRALQDLRERIYTPPAGDVDRLLHAQPPGRADLADDQRRPGARHRSSPTAS